MADRISFSQSINVSVQPGDELYWTQYDAVTNIASQTPQLVGEIINVGANFVEVDNAPSSGVISLENTLFVFRKPNINNTGIKGYYAEVRLYTFSEGELGGNYFNKKTELFAVGSEISQSSK
tara:strand:- start:19 stop:384 length:366 start_codon:yes stop_codon:yes gene_type:complete